MRSSRGGRVKTNRMTSKAEDMEKSVSFSKSRLILEALLK